MISFFPLDSTKMLTTKSLTSYKPLTEQHSITNGITHDASRLLLFPTAAFRHHDIQCFALNDVFTVR